MDEFMRSLRDTFDRLDKRYNKLSRNTYMSYESRMLNGCEYKINSELSNNLTFRSFRLRKRNVNFKGKCDL